MCPSIQGKDILLHTLLLPNTPPPYVYAFLDKVFAEN